MSSDFALRLITWQNSHGRHNLPWQGGTDPYRIWLSEIMLQQTQVETVIPYYRRFLQRFPDLAALARADEEDVLACWSGLGYYSRARHLCAAARLIVSQHEGRFPEEYEAIVALPGIGRSTAAAIAVFAFGQRRAILDGNVRRVLARIFAIEGWPGEKAVENRLWSLAEALLPEAGIRAYTQGLMDLGAVLCTRARPRCQVCPFRDDCLACRQGRQAQLPGPRPKKSVPEKTIAMLILLRAGEVLLEKRPATGVWGSLWSLPECGEGEDPQRAARALGYATDNPRPLPGLTHPFTHFRLFIRPWVLTVRHTAAIAEPGRLWLSLADLEGAALPAPVRRLLSTLEQPQPF